MQWRLLRWGVKGAKQARFYGMLSIVKHPSAKLSIGRAATFRSHRYSNRVGLKQPCMLSVFAGAQLQIGEHCGFSGTVISCHQDIRLGDRVLCGANVTICDSDHHPVDAMKRANGEKGLSRPVTIGNDVWLGMNVVVLKGVTIGDNAVIAANSVVTRDIPPNVVAGGCPAIVLTESKPMVQIDDVAG
nr:DapH/DapD/GlmU-related protein [Bowmanella denitrificans]